MLQQIKKLGAETAVYGIGTVAGRFLNFLLVPFYTNVLLPADYGVVAYLYSLIAFANVFYWYGMESSYFKFATSGDKGKPSETFSTPFIAMLGTSLLFSGALFLARGPVAGWVGIAGDQDVLLAYTAGILFLDAVALLPFAFLRLAHMAKMFAWIRFLNVLSNVLLNVVLLVKYEMGVEGIFISGLISSGLTLLLLAPVIIDEFRPTFNRALLRSMLRFSLPTVPAGLALMALQVIDRPILKALTDDATVGVYQANYRLGIFMMIAVSIYDYAWKPFFFSHAADPDAKKLFSRVMTYLVLILTSLFMAFTFFVPDIARIGVAGGHFIHPRYWAGLGIVPVIMLGYLFLGVSTNLSAGLYIEKKTKYLPPVTMAGAALNITLNYLLIPRYGIAGAAWSTFLAYVIMAGILYLVTRRVYPIAYEWNRLWKISAVSGTLLLISLFLPSATSLLMVALKFLLLLAFPVTLHLLGIFRADEISAVKRVLGIRPGVPASRP